MSNDPTPPDLRVRDLSPAEQARMREALTKLRAPAVDGEPIELDAFYEHRVERLRAEYPDVAKLIGCFA